MSSPEPQLTEQIWNSLKIVVIIIAILGPIIIVFLVLRMNRMKKRLINEHQTNQRLVEKRIEIYDRIGPKLNDIFCFFSYTGNWKELTPMDIMRLKRDLDKDISSNTPLFSDDLIARYNSFILLCFVSHSGWEHEEKIKSLYELRQENIPEWNDDWIPYFDPNNVAEAIKLKERYDELMKYFKKEMSL
jgi:hypothetical protein